jgi:hypothetical protein
MLQQCPHRQAAQDLQEQQPLSRCGLQPGQDIPIQAVFMTLNQSRHRKLLHKELANDPGTIAIEFLPKQPNHSTGKTSGFIRSKKLN